MPEAEVLTGRIFGRSDFRDAFVCPSAVSTEREFAFADTFASVLATTYVNDICYFGAALL